MFLLHLKTAFLCIHVLCMAGAFGALLFYQFGLGKELRDQEANARRLGRVGNALIGIGLLAGLAAYYFTVKLSGGALPSNYHATIGAKISILIGVGACLGLSSALLRKGRIDSASAQRVFAMILLAVASFLGIWL